ncbi:MAG: hypothetical protein NZT92_03275 [Abditibacteriales bacterium]|nr:hypothetical protein [Abditibacteriales bacterium]MDW8364916.1 hypothetical protein [Abditibacteriales bacterium]
MGILIIAIVLAISTLVMFLMDSSVAVTFTVLGKKYQVSGGGFFLATAIGTAFICWIIHVLHARQLKERLWERQNELAEVKERLRRAENNLAAHESRIHEFTLQVLQLARAPLPDHPPPQPEMVFEKTSPPSALNPAPAVPTPPTSETQTVPKVPEPQDTI